MRKLFNELERDNLSDEEYLSLRKMRRKKRTKSNPSEYKIIITGDRCDYDNLSELANHPERGKRVGTFYFSTPNQLELILKAFEGLFYQLYKLDNTERMGAGVMDSYVFEDWWDEPCGGVCECCFLRTPDANSQENIYSCIKESGSRKEQ